MYRSQSSSLGKTVGKIDKNYHFHKLLYNKYPEEVPKNPNVLKDHLKKIKNRVLELSPEQKREWGEIMLLKCLSLQKIQKQHELIASLRCLVEVTNEIEIEYNEQRVEGMIKQIYFNKYGQEIIPLFQRVDYSIRNYQVLEYQEPWYSRLFNFLF